jgi:squalene synthase HpnC
MMVFRRVLFDIIMLRPAHGKARPSVPAATFTEELELYGPGASLRARLSPAEAQRYCNHLARSHYENFTVASWLLPAKLRPHFCNIYAYCRWSDDLADETSGGEASLQLLDWWESQLDDCYRGVATHPVFVALESTIREFEIPSQPFRDLLVAFRQDQNRNRYETFNDLLDYCRNSANPVGRLVLYLGRCHDEPRGELSDSICTGLQLANFWQDVARDFAIGRIYLPLDSCRRAGYDEAMFERHEFNRQFRQLLADEVDRAESFFRAGEPLVEKVPRELRVDIRLFIDGGLAILKAIRRIDFNVWQKRPTVGRGKKLRLLARAWWREGRA